MIFPDIGVFPRYQGPLYAPYPTVPRYALSPDMTKSPFMYFILHFFLSKCPFLYVKCSINTVPNTQQCVFNIDSIICVTDTWRLFIDMYRAVNQPVLECQIIDVFTRRII